MDPDVNDMIRYLVSDCTGQASGIQYGKKGDAVVLISISGNMALVKGKEIFHVRIENLSESTIEKEIIPIQVHSIKKPKSRTVKK
jgi:hypothetical protein